MTSVTDSAIEDLSVVNLRGVIGTVQDSSQQSRGHPSAGGDVRGDRIRVSPIRRPTDRETATMSIGIARVFTPSRYVVGSWPGGPRPQDLFDGPTYPILRSGRVDARTVVS